MPTGSYDDGCTGNKEHSSPVLLNADGLACSLLNESLQRCKLVRAGSAKY